MLSWFFGNDSKIEPKKNRPTDAEIHQMVVAAFQSVLLSQKYNNVVPTSIDIANDIMKSMMTNNPHIMNKGDLIKATKLCHKYAEQVIHGKLIQILIIFFLAI